MPFPTSNLPSNSLPWGRDVQNRIENLETNLKRSTINGEARDTQLAATMSRVETAVNSVISVEEAVFVPGTTLINGGNIAANTIAANKIAVGTLTGFTIQTDTAGQRVVLDGVDDTIKFYNSSDALGGSIFGGGSSGSPFVGVTGTLTVSGGVQASGTISGTGASFSAGAITSGITNTGQITSTGTIKSDGLLRGNTLLTDSGPNTMYGSLDVFGALWRNSK